MDAFLILPPETKLELPKVAAYWKILEPALRLNYHIVIALLLATTWVLVGFYLIIHGEDDISDDKIKQISGDNVAIVADGGGSRKCERFTLKKPDTESSAVKSPGTFRPSISRLFDRSGASNKATAISVSKSPETLILDAAAPSPTAKAINASAISRILSAPVNAIKATGRYMSPSRRSVETASIAVPAVQSLSVPSPLSLPPTSATAPEPVYQQPSLFYRPDSRPSSPLRAAPSLPVVAATTSISSESPQKKKSWSLDEFLRSPLPMKEPSATSGGPSSAEAAAAEASLSWKDVVSPVSPDPEGTALDGSASPTITASLKKPLEQWRLVNDSPSSSATVARGVASPSPPLYKRSISRLMSPESKRFPIQEAQSLFKPSSSPSKQTQQPQSPSKVLSKPEVPSLFNPSGSPSKQPLFPRKPKPTEPSRPPTPSRIASLVKSVSDRFSSPRKATLPQADQQIDTRTHAEGDKQSRSLFDTPTKATRTETEPAPPKQLAAETPRASSVRRLYIMSNMSKKQEQAAPGAPTPSRMSRMLSAPSNVIRATGRFLSPSRRNSASAEAADPTSVSSPTANATTMTTTITTTIPNSASQRPPTPSRLARVLSAPVNAVIATGRFISPSRRRDAAETLSSDNPGAAKTRSPVKIPADFRAGADLSKFPINAFLGDFSNTGFSVFEVFRTPSSVTVSGKPRRLRLNENNSVVWDDSAEDMLTRTVRAATGSKEKEWPLSSLLAVDIEDSYTLALVFSNKVLRFSMQSDTAIEYLSTGFRHIIATSQ